MEEQTKKTFFLYLSDRKKTKKVIFDIISRLNRLEKLLNINLDNLVIDRDKFYEISRLINIKVLTEFSNKKSMWIAKGNFIYALRLFIDYKYGITNRKKIAPRLNPIRY